MKKFILIILITACSEQFTSNHPMAEDDIYLNFQVSNELIGSVVTMVITEGWRCDSISSFRRRAWGFSITCNDYRYGYSVTDKGGEWITEID